MKYKLREYQQIGVTDATRFFTSAQPGDKRLYAAPTGTGKSVVILAIQEQMPEAWIVTPRVEIVSGFLDKLGVKVPERESDLVALALQYGITTPIRLRNGLLRGEIDAPKYLIFDEAHHHEADSWQDIDACTGLAPAIGFTATPYRGTPRSTAEFRKRWGEPQWLLTYSEAAAVGALSMPKCRTLPLVDDDVLSVQNGEFVIQEVEAQTQGKLGLLYDSLRPSFDGELWDRPTMLAVPSRDLARGIACEMRAFGMHAYAVTGDDSHEMRQTIFDACIRRRTAIVQIQVVSEGVDLPIRRLIDLSPALSPVKWLQQFGRITRPSSEPPEYWCCNRNLLRHAYLLDGILPASEYKQAQDAFKVPSNRAGMRAFGLESLGKLKAIDLPLRDGMTGTIYAVSTTEQGKRVEYCVILHPLKAEPLWATRRSVSLSGKVEWGKWARCDPPQEMIGFASVPPKQLSEKQSAWWKRSAAHFGLDPDGDVNRKNFVALPVLANLREKI